MIDVLFQRQQMREFVLPLYTALHPQTFLPTKSIADAPTHARCFSVSVIFHRYRAFDCFFGDFIKTHFFRSSPQRNITAMCIPPPLILRDASPR
jgi:hypothetical protein